MSILPPPLRWGIVGPGDIADRVMAPAMTAASSAELVAVVGRDRGRVEAFAARHGAARTHDGMSGLLADPDIEAVYLATPVDRHAPDALAALAAGRPVLVEKPMALSVREAEAMRDAAFSAGTTLAVCFYQRLNVRHRRVRSLIAEGAIGRVTAARIDFSSRLFLREGSWRQDPGRSGGGVFADHASHAVDLLRFLLGEVRDVAAFVDTLAEPARVEDTASALLRFTSGAQAVVTARWSTEDPSEARSSVLVLSGTDGTIVTWPLHDKASRGSIVLATADGERSIPFEPASTHAALLDDFASAIRERRQPAITADDGVAAMRIQEAVYEAARSGRIVRL
jgi:1,5-anhydro-D-fructose reductase (1,5-anhydro-D-mannitol-forming)